MSITSSKIAQRAIATLGQAINFQSDQALKDSKEIVTRETHIKQKISGDSLY